MLSIAEHCGFPRNWGSGILHSGMAGETVSPEVHRREAGWWQFVLERAKETVVLPRLWRQRRAGCLQFRVPFIGKFNKSP